MNTKIILICWLGLILLFLVSVYRRIKRTDVFAKILQLEQVICEMGGTNFEMKMYPFQGVFLEFTYKIADNYTRNYSIDVPENNFGEIVNAINAIIQKITDTKVIQFKPENN